MTTKPLQDVARDVRKVLLCSALVAAWLPDAALAQRLWFGAHASQYHYGGAPELDMDSDTVTMPGLQFGYQPHPRWSVRVWWERNGVASERYDDPRLELGLVSARWHTAGTAVGPENGAGLRPWLGLGVGELTLEVDTGGGNGGHNDTVAGPEAGIDWYMRENWSLGVGARALYHDNREEWDGAVFLTLNVGLRLGHNHLPRVQALREARDGNMSPAERPPPRRCALAQYQYSPREQRVAPSTGCSPAP